MPSAYKETKQEKAPDTSHAAVQEETIRGPVRPKAKDLKWEVRKETTPETAQLRKAVIKDIEDECKRLDEHFNDLKPKGWDKDISTRDIAKNKEGRLRYLEENPPSASEIMEGVYVPPRTAGEGMADGVGAFFNMVIGRYNRFSAVNELFERNMAVVLAKIEYFKNVGLLPADYKPPGIAAEYMGK